VRTLEADVTLVRDEIHAGVNAADTRIFATTPRAMVVLANTADARGGKNVRERSVFLFRRYAIR